MFSETTAAINPGDSEGSGSAYNINIDYEFKIYKLTWVFFEVVPKYNKFAYFHTSVTQS